MTSSPQKRKNPFGTFVNVLKQKSKYDNDVDALYGTVIFLQNVYLLQEVKLGSLIVSRSNSQHADECSNCPKWN